jgi:hypothetical protein
MNSGTSFMSTVFRVSKYRESSSHLYRALLRQCTYLPDSVARREISRQIIGRFRGYQFDKDALLSKSSDLRDSVQSRVEKRLKVGRQALKTLEKANHGGLVSLNLVLRHAYGRTGKRRHELVQPLLQPSGSGERKIDKPAIANKDVHPWDITTVPTHDIFVAMRHKTRPIVEYHIAPQFEPLKAILASQAKMTSQLGNLSRIREHIPSIPTTNMWGRSMPRKRVKNLATKNYAHLIDRVLPPLPEVEWVRLLELVQGTRPCEPWPKRRKNTEIQKPDHLQQSDLETLTHLDQMNTAHRSLASKLIASSKPVSSHEEIKVKPKPRLFMLELEDTWFEDEQSLEDSTQQILEEEMLLGPRFAIRRNLQNDPSVCTERLLRRQLAAVFSECPHLSWDAQSELWRVEWGIKHSKPKPEITALEPLFKSLNMEVNVTANTDPAGKQP